MRSLWLDQALAAEASAGSGGGDAPRLESDVAADVCVVGGGYTGLWTALRCRELEPSIEVVVLEADLCGAGASGRNGGFVDGYYGKLHALAEICGREEALRLAAVADENVAAVGRFCESLGIDAHFRAQGSLWAATNRAQLAAIEAALREFEAFGVMPWRRLGADEAAARTGSPVHLGGLFDPASATVHPGLLVRGLRRAAVGAGVRIHERTPMTALSRAGPPRVRTPSGTVRAERVVIATNAWASALPEVRGRLLVIGSDVVATAPIPDRLAAIGWTDGMSISDARLLLHYYRTTADGRIVFGKGGGELGRAGRVGRRFEGEPVRTPAVEAHLRRIYPMLGDVRVERSWTGAVDRTRSGLPFFSALEDRPDVFVGVGYSGNGVGPSRIGGHVLASLALGRDDEWSGCGLARRPRRRFPPEPFRSIGGALMRGRLEAKERADDEGRRPRRADLALLRLAPPGMIPMVSTGE